MIKTTKISNRVIEDEDFKRYLNHNQYILAENDSHFRIEIARQIAIRLDHKEDKEDEFEEHKKKISKTHELVSFAMFTIVFTVALIYAIALHIK